MRRTSVTETQQKLKAFSYVHFKTQYLEVPVSAKAE